MKQLLLLIGIVSTALFGSSVEAKAAPFPDMPKDKDMRAAVEWSYKNGIVNGFDDGTFKPNKAISEAEFAKIIANYFKVDFANGYTIQKQQGGKHWSDPYYDALVPYSVALRGYLRNEYRDSAINRGLFAQAIYQLSLNREYYDTYKILTYLYELDITKGKNPTAPSIYDQFGVKDSLTRAELVTFIYRMHNKGIKLYDGEDFFKKEFTSAKEFQEHADYLPATQAVEWYALTAPNMWIENGKLYSQSIGEDGYTYTWSYPHENVNGMSYEKMHLTFEEYLKNNIMKVSKGAITSSSQVIEPTYLHFNAWQESGTYVVDYDAYYYNETTDKYYGFSIYGTVYDWGKDFSEVSILTLHLEEDYVLNNRIKMR